MTAPDHSLGVRAGPDAVGRYQLLEPLGRGGMGTVYRARQVQLGKLVAVKLLDPVIASGAAGVTRFMREARAAAQIHHPNVVEVFDVGVDEGAVFLAMELLQGHDLAALLRSRRLELHEVVELFAPVLAGVRAAHEAGVVHRDLKPSNIFLARRGRTRREPVVLDFGVSRVLLDDELGLTPVTSPDAMIGTAAYIAPEQAKQARLADARSDQFSLGVILYECATGSRPFSGQNTFELLHSIATATVVPPSERNPSLPRAFDELVLLVLSRAPQERFEDLDAMARALMTFAAPRTWMAWGRELVADWADNDASPTAPPSEPHRSPKPLAASPAPALEATPRWRGLTVAFGLGALSSAAVAMLSSRPLAPQAAEVPLPRAVAATSLSSPPRTELAEDAARPLATASTEGSSRSRANSARSVALRPPPPRIAPSARPHGEAHPSATARAPLPVELGQNDAPIIK
ncbi:MAG TPA: protein kinase [Polyangiaceae bacterium]|nr:protein kinase [Polyangiaceae bacterium]